MAYDIPSISDLEAIQLLNKHYAEVITSKKDGVSSAADITQTTNPITGVTRRTLYKILDDAQAEHDNQMQSFESDFDSRLAGMAFTRVGTFTAGATLTDMRQTLLWEVSQGGDGHEYGWTGSFPKVVAAGATPATSGGIGAGAWVDRTDSTLRDELLSGALIYRSGLFSLRDRVSVKDFGAKGDGTTDDTSSIQSAIDYANSMSMSVYLPAGVYIIAGTLENVSHFVGDGLTKTTIKKKTGTSGHIIDILGTTAKHGLHISDISFDVNGIDSAIWFEYVSDAYIGRCEFKNMRLWGVVSGVKNRADTYIRNSRIKFEFCIFDTSSETYEQILIMNSQDVHVFSCFFNNGSSAIGVGIYQVSERIKIDSCVFNIHIGCYYSLSTNNISFINCDFIQCTSAIKGANQSDNGAFGVSSVKNVRLQSCTFYANTTGVQFGAALGVTVSGCLFDQNLESAIIIDSGNNPVNSQSQRISITNTGFLNNNFSGVSSINNPAVLFSGIGGDIYFDMSTCWFHDNQTTHTQLYPVAFVGAFTWNQVLITSSKMSAYSGGMSIGISGATLGDAVGIYDCQDVSSSLPSGVLLRDKKGSFKTTGDGQAQITGTGDVIVKLTAGSSNSSILDLGRSGSTASGRIVHDSGNNTEFYTAGSARLRIDSGGNTKPSSDNVYACGTGSNRWTAIYAASATINTSDERLKTFEDISESERSVAIELKGMIRKFKFNDAITTKGADNARIHFGVGAQSVGNVFRKYGLNPDDYGLFCYDEWEEEPELKNENGDVVREFIPAGNRYGIRYDELICFIIGNM